MAETRPSNMTDRIASMQDFKMYRELHWEGPFEEYLAIVRDKPQVTRNAYQRLYDMIISYGTEEYIDNKKKLIRYNFFKDETNTGLNAIYGLDIPLMRLVHVLRAASEGYGPEKRVILLHGPVGSSKSVADRSVARHESADPPCISATSSRSPLITSYRVELPAEADIESQVK